jgi:hypothetical protein
LAIAITPNHLCDSCIRPIGELDSGRYVKINACAHLFHKGCFNPNSPHYNPQAAQTFNITCPKREGDCHQVVAQGVNTHDDKEKKVEAHITQGQVSPLSGKILSTLKKIVKVALCVFGAIGGVAAYPSWIGLGLGALVGFGAGYLLDKYVFNKFTS